MTHRLLHVSFAFRGTPKVKVKDMEPFFNQATDWYRYAPNCWIVWTTETPNIWYERLRPHILADDYMFIVEIKANYVGWLPKEVADWLKERRESS